MARPRRIDLAGEVYHVLNRGHRRSTLFHGPDDFDEFVQLLAEGTAREPARLVSYCVMPNHWHWVVWPEVDGAVGRFAQWVCTTHAVRHHRRYGLVGLGHLYQGRYRSFAVQGDAHFLRVVRYVEANPVRAGLTNDAASWRWSSLGRTTAPDGTSFLSPGPVPRPAGWRKIVNRRAHRDSLAAVRKALATDAFLGTDEWKLELAIRKVLADVDGED